jgi:putative membrane protein
LAAGIVVVVVGSGTVLAQGMMGGRSGIMNGWGMMGPVMWIFLLLLWGFAIFGLFCAVRWLVVRGRDGKEQGGASTPLDILKSRYARGEIGTEEFERMKKDLE